MKIAKEILRISWNLFLLFLYWFAAYVIAVVVGSFFMTIVGNFDFFVYGEHLGGDETPRWALGCIIFLHLLLYGLVFLWYWKKKLPAMR